MATETEIELLKEFLPDLVDDKRYEYLFTYDKKTKYPITSTLSSSGLTLFHKCILLTRKHPEMINFLRKYLQIFGNDTVNIKCFSGWDALKIACISSLSYTSIDTVQLLIDANMDNDNKNGKDKLSSCLLFCVKSIICVNECMECDNEAIELLLQHGADANFKEVPGSSSWYWITSYLISDRINELAKLFLRYESSGNVNLPLHLIARYCITNYGENIIQELINAGAQVNSILDGKTALHVAARSYHSYNSYHTISIIRILLNSGANPNIFDTYHMTPMHYLSNKCTIELFNMFIEAGVNPYLKAMNGKTALYFLSNDIKKLYKNKILESLKSISVSNGECIICLEETKIYKCSSGHGTCLDCYISSAENTCTFCEQVIF